MPDLTESGRVMAWKRIVNPNDDTEYIDVPCIVQVTFVDQDDGQEYDHSFDNTVDNQGRVTHTVTATNPNDASMTVDVERCTQYSVLENHNDYDIDVILNNNDPAMLDSSGGGTHHAKSHVVRYNKDNTNDPQSVPWVDVELADEVNITGYFPAKDWNLRSSAEMPPTTDEHQEVTFIFANDPGDTGFSDPDDPFKPAWSSKDYWQDHGVGGMEIITGADGKDGPVRLDPFQNIVNINWTSISFSFLFSCGDGMFGSRDGVSWDAAPASVPAISLAYVSGTWFGCGIDGTAWVSTDGAQSWQSVSLPIPAQQVAAVLPSNGSGTDADGNPLPPKPTLAFFGQTSSGDYEVYTSTNQGATWNMALHIVAYPFGGGAMAAYEFINSIDGCGGALFVHTIQKDAGNPGDPGAGIDPTDNGSSGKLYSSLDGSSFSAGTIVWGPGSAGDFGNVGSYSPGGMGYDSGSKTYTLTGLKKFSTGESSSSNQLMYKTSSTPDFGSGDGTVYFTSLSAGGGGDNASGGLSVAGGGRAFATGFYNQHNIDTSGGPFDYYGTFIPGESTNVGTHPFDFSGSPTSSMCFAAGLFGFVVVATGLCEVWTSKPPDSAHPETTGSFSKAFAGTPIKDPAEGSTFVAGALGAGVCSFIGAPANGSGGRR